MLSIKIQKMTQSEISNQLGMSSSTLKRYRNDTNMLSPYRINPNNVKKRPKRPKSMIMVTSKDLKSLQMTPRQLQVIKKHKPKTNLKAGSIQNNIEIIEHYLDKIIKNNKT